MNFFVDVTPIDTNNIPNSHKYLRKIKQYKIMTYLIKYVFQTKKEDLNLSVFNMITGINE